MSEYGGDKKRLLIVVSPLRRGGVEIMAVNLQRFLPPERYERIFYIISDQVEPQEKELLAQGVRCIHRPPQIHGFLQEYRHLKHLLLEGDYDIVHSHLFFYSGMVMRAAAKAGVPKRVAHGHMTLWPRKRTSPVRLYYQWMRHWLQKYATDPVACSEEAGEYLFGRTFFREHGMVINNGVELSAHSFDLQMRERLREEVDVQDRLVIGHVGNLHPIKNQMFLLDVFAALCIMRPGAILWLVGEGGQRGELEHRCKELGISKKVVFCGVRDDAPTLLQAMDILIFPSLFEGVPLAVVEAQGTGLPCLLSDRITSAVRYNCNVDALPLEAPPEQWARRALELYEIPRETARSDALVEDYDLRAVTRRLEEVYDR